MPSRLVNEQPAHVVDAIECVATLVENRRAAQRLDAVGHDPEGLARGVIVGCADLHDLASGL